MNGEWQLIATAPKSTSTATQHGEYVKGVYLLGFAPDPHDDPGTDPRLYIRIVWWEPNHLGNGKGAWVTDTTERCNPTHWMPLPEPPK
jgi:hypothetical protein